MQAILTRGPREIDPMKMTLKAAAALALAAPFSATLLHAQTTGVSHPEDIAITTSPDGISQPVVYTSTPVATLKVRTEPAIPVVPVTPVALVTEEKPVLSASAAVPATALETDEVSPADSDRPAKTFLLAPESTANVISRVAGPGNELPIGTMLNVKLAKALTTRTTASGTEFEALIAEAVLRDGRVLIPAGSVLSGLVTEVHGGRRMSGNATLHLRPESVTLPDGVRYGVSAQVIDTDQYHSTKVDEEGTIKRKDHPLKTLGVFALSAGSGAAAGAVFGGVPGALIGAGVGLGISTVVWLKQDRQAEMPAGTKMVFSLTKPMVFGSR